MKKLLALIFVAAMVLFPSAKAQVTLADSPVNLDSVIAANEFGAASAYFSPLDDYIYYLKAGSEGSSVVVFDAAVSDYKTVKSFSPDADYLSIAADEEGNIYLLRRDKDETAKSGIVSLIKENDDYIITETLFPAASGELIPVSFEFSPYSSMGAVRFWLNCQGEYVSFVSPISVFWGSLLGLDEIIYLVPGELTAKIQPLEEFFDAYGYQTQAASEFLKKIETGEYLSPSEISLSPNGNMLLMLVAYQGNSIVYVMDLYTNGLEILYLPDEFEGSVSWTFEGGIVTTDTSGQMMNIEWSGFTAGSWNSADGFSQQDQTDDWSNIPDGDLSDWS